MEVFEFDYDRVHGQPLFKAVGQNPIKLSNGTVAFDAVSLILDRIVINISVNIDSDEIVLSTQEEVDQFDGWVDIAQMSHFLNKPLGWGWSARNSNGYRDFVILSFDGLSPQIGFLGEASRISVIPIGNSGNSGDTIHN